MSRQVPTLIGNTYNWKKMAVDLYLEHQQQQRLESVYQSSADLESDSSLPGAGACLAELHGTKKEIVDSSRHFIDHLLRVLEERS